MREKNDIKNGIKSSKILHEGASGLRLNDDYEVKL